MVERVKIKTLKFAEAYLKKLESGKKLMTIRRGKKDFKVGDLVRIIAGNKKIGIARIVKVETKKFGEITKADAIKDGFKSKRKLREALKKHYKKIKSQDLFTLIEFEWVTKSTS